MADATKAPSASHTPHNGRRTGAAHFPFATLSCTLSAHAAEVAATTHGHDDDEGAGSTAALDNNVVTALKAHCATARGDDASKEPTWPVFAEAIRQVALLMVEHGTAVVGTLTEAEAWPLLSKALQCPEAALVLQVLHGLQAVAIDSSAGGQVCMPAAEAMELAEVVERAEELQCHENVQVYEAAHKLLSTAFMAAEEEDYDEAAELHGAPPKFEF